MSRLRPRLTQWLQARHCGWSRPAYVEPGLVLLLAALFSRVHVDTRAGWRWLHRRVIRRGFAVAASAALLLGILPGLVEGVALGHRVIPICGGSPGLAFAHGGIQWLAADAATTVYTVSGLSFQPKALAFAWQGLQVGSGQSERRLPVGGFYSSVLMAPVTRP